MHNFLFGIYPYIALSVLIIGSIARYERDPFTWKTSSSQLLRRRQLMLGSVLFHVGVLVIFFGHLVGLLTPIWIFDALGITHGAKQTLAVVAGGIAGVMALIGGLMLFHRRITDPRIRKTSSFADIGILALLLAQLVLGIGTIFVSLEHLDGYEMTKFMAWAQGIFTFQSDAASHITNVAWIFKLHLVLGLTIFLVFPFTRLVHMLSVPVRYFLRPGYQIVRSRRTRPLSHR
ncbi:MULTISPECIES: respiratory nitrate reductase subunit gamma [Thalassospira]|uniref:nitrate reductase (quinone) n=2 Tax=Thalassospira tepidiphila TaxID=393657 RepID=A0A853L3D1_9PROT|nr:MULTISPECIES: respiratory nitrate reductase subunit gamma [Thalassospira]MBE72470.1 respiratory nitrate reductase subunit gamma [Thalassospira sp.]MBO6581238.1 respiratory nitrate reductase subunit gamma [Thalassospira sp.]MBO6817119.1 respiratory nitrate reductase subunit gamma [Thalassospira sp.]NJB74017.1 nitrate reductase gamma subunit [Thalassospira tepidiphila]OAZ11830.1 nitrate reductase [Thalassospira tepidiphila MCCC 1A03514]|tara:strand:- start:600 stop:1295 length:696 start_codon:yes stop_codon:yes gene_type:complete